MDLIAMQLVEYMSIKLYKQLTIGSGRCVPDGPQSPGIRNWADVAAFTETGKTEGSQVWGRRT